MRALQIIEPGRAEIVEISQPRPGPGQVLVQVEGVTTCPQWDLHIMSGQQMFPDEPLSYPYTPGQPGHEAVGVVMEVGDRVRSLTPGTRVAAWCDPGHDKLGSYAEYVVRDENDLLEVPKGLSAESIAPLELAMCVRMAFEALEQHDAVEGQRFGISGLGPAGLIAVQLAQIGGAGTIIGYDFVPQRRQLAMRVGADLTFDPSEVELPDNRWERAILDSAVDCAGSASSVQFLMDRTRHAVALFGVLRDEVSFGWRHFMGLTLLGYRPGHRHAAEAVLDHVVHRRLDLEPLVTETLPLTDYGIGIKLLRDQRAMKVCFRP